jgi:SAM-dependent methyltransferase
MVRGLTRRGGVRRGSTSVTVGPTRSAPVSVDDWNRHWADFGDLAAESPAKAFRHGLVAEALAEHGPPARVLDIGSGSGDLAVRLRAAFPRAELLGLELSRVGVERSRERVSDATFLERNLLEDQQVAEEHRAWATHAGCSEVLEHVENPEILLAHARPYLAPGCRLVVTVPAGPMSAFDRHIGHRRHFTTPSLRQVLEAAGFEVDWVHGAGFPFFNLYRLAVVGRGARLASDVSTRPGGPPLAARLAMRVFGLLFRVSGTRGRRGWQLVASAALLSGGSDLGHAEH